MGDSSQKTCFLVNHSLLYALVKISLLCPVYTIAILCKAIIANDYVVFNNFNNDNSNKIEENKMLYLIRTITKLVIILINYFLNSVVQPCFKELQCAYICLAIGMLPVNSIMRFILY